MVEPLLSKSSGGPAMLLPYNTFLSCMVARRARWFAAGRPAIADRPAASFLAVPGDEGFEARVECKQAGMPF